MKQYLIDELRPADHDKIKDYLDKQHSVPGFEGLYWIDLPEEFWEEKQAAHADCRPHYFALELLPDRLACELLIRSRQRIRCDCIHYASERQRDWAIGLVDAIFERLGISC
jgi:hypothetical protein